MSLEKSFSDIEGLLASSKNANSRKLEILYAAIRCIANGFTID
jgi:hypothetical protein